jgi:hypothetical protein
MSLERGGMNFSQKDMENIRTNNLEVLAPVQKPEILSPDQVRILIPHDPEVAHYNAAVIQSKNNEGEILILCREVPMEKRKPGFPDMGNLYIYRAPPGKEKAEKLTELNLNHPEVCNWEDARAYVSNYENNQEIENEKVLIGLTAIRKADNCPMAATIEGEIIDGNFSVKFEALNVYPNDEGKNVTPISDTLSLFRRNGEEGRHSLEVVEHSKDDKGNNKLNVKNIIEFPPQSWCEWQIGTQAQRLPNGILPIHGVNKFELGINPETGKVEDGYTYSLGLAQLDDDLNLIKITDSPLFNRESFKNVLEMGKEMDTNKDVVYCCGYSIHGETVKFIINIGDLTTVEVSKSLNELNEILKKTPLIKSGKIPDETTIFQKSA